MKKYIYISLLSFLSVVLAGCFETDPKRKKDFPWEADWVVPDWYTMKLIDGAFICNGRSVEIKIRDGFDRIGYKNYGWNSKGLTGVPYKDSGSLPGELHLHWYSLTEDKFYEGTFTLPYEQILKLFREGFKEHRTKKQKTYCEIIAGVAPGGRVIVWIRGNGKQVEVGSYQAQESEYLDVKQTDWFYYATAKKDNMETYRVNILKNDDKGGAWRNLERNGIPLGLWDTYRERFKLRPVVVYRDSTCITDEIYMGFFNNEKETLVLKELENNEFRDRARIKYLEAYWSLGQTIWKMHIGFNEEEIFRIYKDIYRGNPNYPVEIEFWPDEENSQVKVYFASYPRKIQVKHAKINLSREREDERHFFEVFKNKVEP